ncbi:MAG: dihydroneopterin aldolase [Acidimicrobiia bacterium]
MNDRIELRGLRFAALVGALPEERDRHQPIEVDVDVEADLAVAGGSDLLADTIDYGALCAAVEAEVGAGHVALLERLAERLAGAVLAADGRVAAVTVAVRKLRPPVPQHLDTSGVRIRRAR